MHLISGVFVQDQIIGASLYISPSFSCGPWGNELPTPALKEIKQFTRNTKASVLFVKTVFLLGITFFPPHLWINAALPFILSPVCALPLFPISPLN